MWEEILYEYEKLAIKYILTIIFEITFLQFKYIAFYFYFSVIFFYLLYVL